jgi:hypothetical protein
LSFFSAARAVLINPEAWLNFSSGEFSASMSARSTFSCVIFGSTSADIRTFRYSW